MSEELPTLPTVKTYQIAIEYPDGTRASIEIDNMVIKKEPHIDVIYLYLDGVKAIKLFRGVAQIDTNSIIHYNSCQWMQPGLAFLSKEPPTMLIQRVDIITNKI